LSPVPGALLGDALSPRFLLGAGGIFVKQQTKGYMKQKFETVATAVAMIILIVAGLATDPMMKFGLWSCAVGFGLRHLLVGVACRYFVGGMTAFLAAAMITAPVQAQNTAYRDAPTYVGEPYDYGASVLVMLPDPSNPNGQHEVGKIPFIAGAICVGVFVGVVGWLGIRILRGVINVNEVIVTNNAAQPVILQKSPFPDELPDGATHPYSVSPLPVSVFPGAPGSDIFVPNGYDPAQPCPSTFEGATDLLGDGHTVAMLMEHSFDSTNWVTVARGITAGQTVVMPDTGFWRLRPLALRLEVTASGPILHAPPGILERSSDLRNWAVVSDNQADVELPAQAGTFYRVRL